MNNRKIVRWIIGVGCLFQFTLWNVAMETTQPAAVEPAAASTAPRPPAAAPASTGPADPPPPTPTPTLKPRKDTALYALGQLKVSQDPASGYRRARFGKPWADTDGNHCDQRNDTLRRDLRKRHTQPGSHGCILAKGILVNPYTGNSIKFDRGDGDIQIDHVVSLHDAWNAGVKPEERRLIANDPMNLIATSSYSNQSKGDDRADEWLPKEWTYLIQCGYVRRQIAVKKAYGLSVTLSERDAMVRVLQDRGCHGAKLPMRQSFNFPTPRPMGEPKVKPTTKPTTKPTPPKQRTAHRRLVHPGAFCAPAGARGVTSTGTAMVCKSTARDSRNRWRAR